MTENSKLSILLALSLAVGAGSGCSAEPPPAADEAEAGSADVEEPEPQEPEGVPTAVVRTNKGTFAFQLLPEAAPRTVENFIELTKRGFYYKSTFHRVIPGTIIQGGDPNSKDNNPYNDGQGNSGKFLPGEVSELPFERGTVAMAHSGDPSSASCQFFVCLKRVPGWDGKYTIFGKVVEGIEVVDELSRAPHSKNPRLKDYPAGKIIMRVSIEYR